MIRILGLDPGIADTGWGLIEAEGNRYRHIEHGSVKTPAGMDLGERLDIIYTAVENVISRYQPTACGIEELYFAKNISSALPVAHARGVLVLALKKAGIETGHYSPPKIKQTITGIGTAQKAQVQEMVRLTLGLADIPRPDHAADALAAALSHAICRTAILRGIV